MSRAALTVALLSMSAVALMFRTPTFTPAATPAPPPIARVAATTSMRYWLAAVTTTDWLPAGVPLVGSSISVLLPIVAFVLTVMMSTVPETPTPALPPTDASTPTEAMSSLFVATTATPLTVCCDCVDRCRAERGGVRRRHLALLHDAVRAPGRLRLVERDRAAALARGELERLRVAAAVLAVADEVVRPAVDEAADRSAAARAVDDRVAAAQAERVRQRDAVAGDVRRRVEVRVALRGGLRRVRRDEAVRLAGARREREHGRAAGGGVRVRVGELHVPAVARDDEVLVALREAADRGAAAVVVDDRVAGLQALVEAEIDGVAGDGVRR